MKVKVIGLATTINITSKNWTKGVESTGMQYKLLGMGQKFTGWKMRSKLYLNELMADTDTDIFIISDVYDVLVNQKVVQRIKDTGRTVEDHILSIFYQFKKPIVVGAENSCGSPAFCYSYSFSSSLQDAHKFPNAGLLIGYRSYLIELYRHLLNYSDDQLELGKLVHKYPHKFALDTESKLFYNFKLYPDKEKFRSALFVHFPGMKYIIPKQIGYNSLKRQGYESVNTNLRSVLIGIGAIIGFIIIIFLLRWLYNKLDSEKMHDISYHLFA